MDMTRTSKFISLVLRHKPETIGLILDAEGWASVPDLLERMAAHGHVLSLDQLETLVVTNDKKRFTLSDDKTRIRAAQGHSLKVSLGFEPVEPPAVLFHGTATRFVEAIRTEGLTRQSRQHVHLSPDVETATKVGQRHGKPHIFTVDALAMVRGGHSFYRAENGVWLTDRVPAEFLEDKEGAN